ncbi:MAG: aspartate/glutamate racemase family protein [Chloroflexota bacterium]
MAQRLALVHTVGSLEPVFASLARELLPDAEMVHVVDETLLKDAIREGGLTPEIRDRLRAHVADLAPAADAILVTCSSMGPAVEIARDETAIPVLRVDEPMADEAVRLGRRIGVLATLSTTLEPTADLVRRRAVAAGRGDTEVVPRVVEGAFDALSRGDRAEHDRLVGDALIELGANVDVVVLAQASMARVADALPPGTLRVPVLSSPRSGMERLAAVVHGLRTSAEAKTTDGPQPTDVNR